MAGWVGGWGVAGMWLCGCGGWVDGGGGGGGGDSAAFNRVAAAWLASLVVNPVF